MDMAKIVIALVCAGIVIMTGVSMLVRADALKKPAIKIKEDHVQKETEHKVK